MPDKKTTTTKPKKTSKKSAKYTYAVGRRKTATARVRLYPKKGDHVVNGMPAVDYFPGELAQAKLIQPLKLTSTDAKFHFTVKVEGSGKNAQLDAAVHGISRALSKIDADTYRPELKKAGLLTRDDRMKESRKVGTGGKARRKKQSPKR
jgi:small subunit ribosomal protein S9